MEKYYFSTYDIFSEWILWTDSSGLNEGFLSKANTTNRVACQILLQKVQEDFIVVMSSFICKPEKKSLFLIQLPNSKLPTKMLHNEKKKFMEKLCFLSFCQ